MSTDIAPGIARTERGLVVAGARTTLYAILDYLHADVPRHLIREWLNLTAEQMNDVLEYINTHCDDIEEEYQQVLREDIESRRYWDERNHERFAQIAMASPTAEKAAIYAELKARRAALEQLGEPVADSDRDTCSR